MSEQTTVPEGWIDPFPMWSDCEIAVEEGRASALEAFIYENEPAGEAEEPVWRWMLSNVILEANRG